MKSTKHWSQWSGYSQGILRALPTSDSHFTLDADELQVRCPPEAVHCPPAVYQKKAQVKGSDGVVLGPPHCSPPQSLLASQTEARRQSMAFEWPLAIYCTLQKLKVWYANMQDVLTIIHTPSRGAEKLTGSVPFTKSTVSPKTYIRGHDFWSLSLNFAKLPIND